MDWLIRFFYFSRGEVNGILVLLVLIGMSLTFPLFVKLLMPETMRLSPIARQEISRFMEETKKGEAIYAREHVQASDKRVTQFAGMSVANDSRGAGEQSGKNLAAQQRIPVIEINKADSLILQLLPGIGPAFASRIVRFRDRMGGFYAKEQLLEVYGLDSVRFQGLQDYIRVDTGLVKRIRINEVAAEDLGRHPLIGYKMGNLIVRYREHNGAYRGEGDLRKLGVLEEETIKKLSHYLVF